jgi:hypothetical protein
MSVIAIATVTTSAGSFTPLTASGTTGKKRITVVLPASHIMTTTGNNSVETVLPTGQYIMEDVPGHLYFKSSSGASTVNAFFQN